jgi:hypothetical protein
LKSVPLFALLDDDATAVLAAQVELKPSAREQTSHRTTAIALVDTSCIKVSRADIGVLMVVYTPTNFILRTRAWDPSS